MTSKRVSIFVEGRDLDPVFYSRLCGSICTEQGFSYEIIVADRISGGGGGKNKLTKLFENLRRRNSLVDRSGPNAKLVMFYLDKDSDDIFKRMRKSAHVVYTSCYCVENHLFCEGDLLAGIANGGTIDIEVVRSRVPDPAQWRQNAAIAWREWTALCLTAQKLQIGGPASYGVEGGTVASRTDPSNLAVWQAELYTRSGKAIGQFNRIVKWARNKANRVITSGKHDLLFKGKWYAIFAADDLEQIDRANGPINMNGADYRLVGSLISTLRFDGPWSEHYREPLRRALNTL